MAIKDFHTTDRRLIADILGMAPGVIGVAVGLLGSFYLFDPQAFGSWRNGVAIFVATFAIIVAQPFLMQYFEMRAVRKSLLDRADKLVDDSERLAIRIEEWESGDRESLRR